MDDAAAMLQQLLDQARQEGYERCKADMRRLMNSLQGARQLVTLTDENRHDFEDVVGLRLRDLALSGRVVRALWTQEVHTVGDLASCTRDTLLSFRNIGVQGVGDCEELLKQYGLRLQQP